MHEAEKYLSEADDVLAGLIAKHGTCPLSHAENNPFHALVRAIISQQLSVKAVDTIQGRISQILPQPYTVEAVLLASAGSLRAAGLSTQKTKYIQNIAEQMHYGKLNLDDLANQPDEAVISCLMKLKGVGRWTAEMFLIFGLKRPDIISLGDAGLQRSAKILYPNFEENELLKRVSDVWRPYRSIASWYLWRHLDQL